MDSNIFNGTNNKNYLNNNNKISIIPKSYSRDSRTRNDIFIKKFEMKLPNFNRIKIR